MSKLPGILAEIAEIAGDSVATRLALAAGGTIMTFSASPRGKLAAIVGADAAKLIAEALGAQKYTIPMANLRGQKGRQAQAAKLLAAGATANEVAKTCDVHVRTAHRVRKRIRETEDLPLFPRRRD